MSELGKVIEELERFERDTRDFRGQPMSLLMPDQVEALTEYGKAVFAHAPTLIAAAKRAEQAEAEVGRLRESLEDFAAYGCRHDTNPTICGEWDVARWYSYISGMDAYVRDNAKQALTPPPTANEGATTLEGAGGEVRADAPSEAVEGV